MSTLAVVVLSLFLLAGCSPQDSDHQSPEPGVDAASSKPVAINPAGNPDRARTITIAADPWCPHNCIPGSGQEGYMVDIARDILTEAGYTVEYVNISWARALQMTRDGLLDAVVGAFISDAPDFVFPEIPQGRSTIAMYTHRDNTWRYGGPESLQDQKLLIINGYSYTPELDSYIAENQANPDRIWVISGPSPLDRALYLLDKQRTDIFVEDAYVMAWWAGNRTHQISLPRQAGLVSESESFVAFSPAREDSPQLAKLLSEGTRQRLNDGRFQQILDHYGLNLWTQSP